MKTSVNPSESASTKRAAATGDGRAAAGRPAVLLLAVGLAVTAGWCGAAVAQQQPIDPLALPVMAPPEPMGFIADSPVAADTLRRIGEHIRGNNIEPAAALLRQLLAEQPHALVPVQSDPDLHEPVRSHARRLLAVSPPLLQRVTDALTAETERLTAAGDWATLERSWFFTAAGQRAAVELAREHIAAGRFDAAALTLADLAALPTVEPAAAAQAKVLGDQLASVPASTLPKAISSLDPQPALAADALAPMPLGTLRMDGARDAIAPVNNRFDRFEMINEPLGPTHRNFPILADSTVFIASARTLAACELPDLRVKWKTDILAAFGLEDPLRDRPQMARFNRGFTNPLIEEISTVTWFGRLPGKGGTSPAGVLVAVATFEDTSVGTPGQFLVGVDAETGQIRWAHLVEQLDKSLEGNATVRGSVLASGDTAVVNIRKYQPDRRLGAAYLFGLDAWTGEVRWLTAVTSAGVMPQARGGTATELSSVERGIVYHADRLGAVSAHRAHDGRALWVRRVATEPLDAGISTRPFMASGPVLTEKTVVSISAERRRIRVIDRATGAAVGIFPSSWLESPLYMITAGTKLVAIGERSMAVVELAKLPELIEAAKVDAMRPPGGAISVLGLSTPRGGWARAAAVGNQVAIPEVSGLTMVDLGTMQPRSVRLDAAGNVLSTGSGVLLSSDSTLASVMSLDSVLGTLRRNLTIAPTDDADNLRASSCERLARLSVRLGRTELLAEAAEGFPGNALRAGSRDRTEVLGLTLAAVFDGASGDIGRRLVASQERLAVDDAERGAVALAAAVLAVRSGEAMSGFERAQLVGSTPAQAAGVYRDSRMTMRIGDEAINVMRTALAAMDKRQRAEVERRAAVELAAFAADGSAEALSTFARRFPATASAATAQERAAELAAGGGSLPRRARLLFEAVRTLTGLVAAGVEPVAPAATATPGAAAPEPLVAQRDRVAGRLRTLLTEQSLTGAMEQLDQVLAGNTAKAKPTSGLRLAAGGVQSLPGWAIAEPLLADGGADQPAELLLRHESGRIALFAAGPAAGDAGGGVVGAGGAAAAGGPANGPLAERWSAAASEPTDVLTADAGKVLLIDRRDGAIRAIERATGKPMWQSKPFSQLAPPAGNAEKPADDAGKGAPLIQGGRRLPFGRGGGDSPRGSEELLVSTDGSTIAIVQRSGAVVMLSSVTGELVKATRVAGVERIADAKLLAGVLGVVSSQPGTEESRLTILPVGGGDAVAAVLPASMGPLRAVRATEWGELVVVGEQGIACFDGQNIKPLWMIDEGVAAISEAWTAGSTLVLLDTERRVWTVALDRGTMSANPTLRGTSLPSGAVRVSRPPLGTQARAEGTFAISTGAGLSIISQSGTVLGSDALDLADGLLPPVRVGGTFFAVSTVTARVRDEQLVFNVHSLDAGTARALWSGSLLLATPAHRVAACGDRLAITAGHSTVVYRTEPVR
jgi:outer membrane protein assembly factor BamB